MTETNHIEDLAKSLEGVMDMVLKKKDILMSKVSEEDRKKLQDAFSKVDFEGEKKKLKEALNALRQAI